MTDLDRSIQPAPGAIRDYQMPAVHSRTLANGVRSVVCRAGHIPLVTAHVIIDAGAATESAAQAGIAQLTANALEGGTATRSGTQLAWDLENLGLELTAWTSWDATHVRVTATATRIDEALSILADIVRNAAFPDSEVERIRDEQIGEIMQRIADPRALADDMSTRFIYAYGSTYQRSIYATAEGVRNLTTSDVRAFHAARFQPGTVAVLLVGDIDDTRGHALVERAFGAWKGSAAAASPMNNTPAATTTTVHIVDRPGSVQSEMRLGHVGVSRSNPDHFVLLVLNAILGGAFTSRLNLNLREKNGFTYGARSGYGFRRGDGPFVIQAAVGTDVTGRALEEAFKEVRTLVQNGVTEDEVANARDFLAGVFPLQMQSTEELAARLSEIIVYDLPDDYFQDYRDRILAVSVQDVNIAAPRYIKPDAMAVVIVGDAAALRGDIEKLGLGEIHVESVDNPTQGTSNG